VITDPLFYRLFETSPETFFLLLGWSADAARELAQRYQYQALEFKETAFRSDGVFQPTEPGLPVYFLEVQFYALPSVYADILAKAYTYLKQRDPTQPYCAVVLFASRALAPAPAAPYQPLLDAGLLRRLFLDQLPPVSDAPLGLAILYLIGQEEEQAALTARSLVARARAEIKDAALRADLVELIETVIVAKLSRLSREEIQAMLNIHDLRETRVYQEARAEGIEKGIDQERRRVRQEKLKSVPKLAGQATLRRRDRRHSGSRCARGAQGDG
jgi:predicted transposase/invertase (TIGR01784 family)